MKEIKITKQNERRKEKGITLIALVISIIVLLILAGVSIAMLTGDNGILTQAQNAKKATERASIIEQVQLDILEKQTVNGSGDITAGELEEILKKYFSNGDQNLKDIIAGTSTDKLISKEDETIKIDLSEIYNGDIKDGTTPPEEDNEATVGVIVQPGEGNKDYTSGEYTAKIPEGFMIVPGCEDISKGLVISDDPDDTEADSSSIVAEGNQFVWIPVASGAEYIRDISYADTNVSTTAYTDKEYLPDGIAPTIPEETTEPEDIGLINEVAEREAVAGKGGFYISRYEAGLEGTDTLVSKKGATVWTDKSQEEFKEIGKSFEVKSPEKVKSAMCSGIQWDMAMKFITENDEKYDVINATVSWHQGSEVVESGQNEEDKACNIYDLESNSYEYVAEKNSYDTECQFVGRGGNYYSSVPASYRGISYGTAAAIDCFRFVLYVM